MMVVRNVGEDEFQADLEDDDRNNNTDIGF